MPAFALDGRVVVITGSASGIGRATAKLFASEGARIVALDRDEAANQQLEAELRSAGGAAETVALDLRDRKAVLSTRQRDTRPLRGD